MSDNVVPIGLRAKEEILGGIDEVIEHLKANRENIKSMVIVLGDGDGFATWLGPDAQSVSHATDFVKAILAEDFRLVYAL